MLVNSIQPQIRTVCYVLASALCLRVALCSGLISVNWAYEKDIGNFSLTLRSQLFTRFPNLSVHYQLHYAEVFILASKMSSIT